MSDAEKVHKAMADYYDTLDDWSFTGLWTMDYSKLVMDEEFRAANKYLHPTHQKEDAGACNMSPGLMEGLKLVDIGCAQGRDAFICSKMVGEKGHVIGIDISGNRIQQSNDFKKYHKDSMGYKKSNCEFYEGSVTDLKPFGLKDQSQDMVVSSGVVCLVPDKEEAYREAYRVLKYGGEFHQHDCTTSQRLIKSVENEPKLWAEGMSTLCYWDNIAMLKRIGFTTPRHVYTTPYVWSCPDPIKKDKFGTTDVRFLAVQMRMFKLPPGAVQKAQRATYNGGIPYNQRQFQFDSQTLFKKGIPMAVDGELAAILEHSRFAPYFTLSPLQKGDIIQTDTATYDVFANAPH